MEKTFYDITSNSTMLREGSYLTVQRSLNYRGERADFTPFLDVPLKELEQRLKASKAEERKIYDQLQEAAKAWDEHGAQTLLLQKAIEYLKVPEVKHTANEWKQQQDGSWEISNLVYKMTFSIVRCRGRVETVLGVVLYRPRPLRRVLGVHPVPQAADRV